MIASLNHVVEGPADAPALVLLNSLGTDLRIWEQQVAALREEFRLVRCDTRGHGSSPVPPAPYSVEDLGADVIALLDLLDIERASLCGVSLGGATALWLAANAPERIECLGICFSSPHFGAPEGWEERAATVRAKGMAAVVDRVVDRWFTPGFAERRPALVEEMRDMLGSTPVEGYAGCCEALAQIDLREELARVTAPTLVISGAEDTATSAAQGRRIATGVPGAAFAEIPGAAHLGNLEQPELVNSLLLAHLKAGARR